MNDVATLRGALVLAGGIIGMLIGWIIALYNREKK